MTKLVAKFAKDESGATAIEYGLIAALIAVAIIAGAGMIGSKLNAKFAMISTTISGA
jgi:pilus assembly protein Flp/PilA